MLHCTYFIRDLLQQRLNPGWMFAFEFQDEMRRREKASTMGSSSTRTTCTTERRSSGFVMSAEDYLDFASPGKRERLGASQRATFSGFIEFHEHNFIVFSEA